MGARGVVVTDALEMKGVVDAAPDGEAPLRALCAGCDLLLWGAYTDETMAMFDSAARRWSEGGEAVLPLARWEAARGAIDALYAAALAAERSDHDKSSRGEARSRRGALADPAQRALLVPPGWDAMLDGICRRPRRRQHDPDGPRRLERRDEGGKAVRHPRPLDRQRPPRRRIAVMHDAIMPSPQQPPHDVPAHPAETDDAELHAKLLGDGTPRSERGSAARTRTGRQCQPPAVISGRVCLQPRALGI